jgi:rubredoxin
VQQAEKAPLGEDRANPRKPRKNPTNTELRCYYPHFNRIRRLSPWQVQKMDTGFKTWMCLICGWVYDEEQGAPEDGLAPGTRWADVPINWTCPECGARKEDFELTEI